MSDHTGEHPRAQDAAAAARQSFTRRDHGPLRRRHRRRRHPRDDHRLEPGRRRHLRLHRRRHRRCQFQRFIVTDDPTDQLAVLNDVAAGRSHRDEGIVKEAGGRVGIYSEVGFGTAMKVDLPATDALADAPAPTAARSPTPRGQGETVRLVEDEVEVRRVTERILAGAGYRVIAFARGADALSNGRLAEVDLLVTDVIMPGMLGTELVERARAARTSGSC